ncbi:MAG: response regulator [Acidimicrobiia bacterium]|nr:response regulator [Acidimicrobiia bacterium]
MASRARVMVVDDSAQLRSALETLIGASAAFEVVATARDGAEAVDLAKKHRPDVILMDVRMPGMDGVEATRRILADMSGVNVVAHTAYDDAELVADMVKAGARGYLVKGVTADELFDGLSSALEGEARISASATRGLFEEVGRAGVPEGGGETEVLAARLSSSLVADTLTGTLQRAVFQFELEQAVTVAADTRSPLGVGVVRVCDLHEVNARFGWAAGDALLRGCSGVVLDVVGPGACAGRLDGDELGVVLPGHDAVATRRVLDTVGTRIRTHVILEDVPNRIAVGFTCIDGTGIEHVDPDLVLDAARGAARAAPAGTVLRAGHACLCDPGTALTLDALLAVLGGEPDRLRARHAAELAAGMCEVAGRPACTAAAFAAALAWSHVSGAGNVGGEPVSQEGLAKFETLLALIAGRHAADLFADVGRGRAGGAPPHDLARCVDVAARFAALPPDMPVDARCAALLAQDGPDAEEVLGWLRRVGDLVAP